MKMFKKICFLVTALSIAFSAESFARKTISSEQALEKKSLARARANAKRTLRKEQAAAKRSTRRVISRNSRVEKNSLQRSSRIASAQKRQKPKSVLPRKQRDGLSKGRVVKSHSKQVAAASSNDSYVNIDGVITKGKDINVTRGDNGSYIVDIDGNRTIIHNVMSVSNNSNSKSVNKTRNGRHKMQSTSSKNYSFTTMNNEKFKGLVGSNPEAQKEIAKHVGQAHDNMKEILKRFENTKSH